MPTSAATFRSVPVVGFYPADPDNVLSGTTTMSSTTPGVYGIAVAASQTVKLQFEFGQLGIERSERFTPYEQYNIPKTRTLNQTSLTVYYQVTGAAMTSFTIGLYATLFGATPVVTTVIAQAANGLQTAVGSYATVISLKGLSVPVPLSELVAELDIVTPVSSSFVINGVSLA